jgi:7-cyano-7-deazaguanine synthase
MIGNTALVLFSGGQDSTTCLAWALTQFGHVETVGFDYGQRHSAELAARPHVLDALKRISNWKTKLGADHVLPINTLRAIGGTALTDEMKIEMGENGLRRPLFRAATFYFSCQPQLSARRGISDLSAACGDRLFRYPDCRDETIQATARAVTSA